MKYQQVFSRASSSRGSKLDVRARSAFFNGLLAEGYPGVTATPRGPRLELRSLPVADDASKGEPGPHFVVVGEEGRRSLAQTPRTTGGVLFADESVAFVPLTTEMLRELLNGVLP